MYSEATLIRKIRERFGNAAAEVAVGDDAAVVPLPRGFSAVLCSDLLAEDTHFRRESHPPESIGHKAIAANVSDIGAMGAIPGYCLVSLAVPGDIEDEWIDRFLDGVEKACRRFEVELVGGDSSTAERIVVDVAMMGRVETGRSIQRCGAGSMTEYSSPDTSAVRPSDWKHLERIARRTTPYGVICIPNRGTGSAARLRKGPRQ